MELYYATTNKGKLHSLQREFKGSSVTVVHAPLDIPEPRLSDVQEIARHKVQVAYEQLKKPVAALDAGFYIHAHQGFPRTFVNFALETIDLDGILKLVEGTDRSCEFRDCLAYLDSELKEPRYFFGHVHGMLADAPRGTIQPHHWSRLASVFIPEGSEKTLAEMTEAEYMVWRAQNRELDSPARHFAEWLVPRVSKN